MLAVVVALADFEGQPTLEFLQGQTGALFGLARLAATRRVAGGARQTLQPLHQRAIHALDVAAIVRAADRPMDELDAVLSAALAKGAAAELSRVVQVQPLRQAGHRPVDLQPEVSQPGRLGLDDATDQEGHGAGTGPLHADEEGRDRARGQIDGHRQPGPADDLAGEAVDDQDVGLGVVDLHDLQRPARSEAAGHDCSAWERGQMLEFLAAVRTQPARHRVA